MGDSREAPRSTPLMWPYKTLWNPMDALRLHGRLRQGKNPEAMLLEAILLVGILKTARLKFGALLVSYKMYSQQKLPENHTGKSLIILGAAGYSS